MDNDVEGPGNRNSSSWAEGQGSFGYYIFNNSPEKEPVQDRFEPRVEDVIDDLNKLKTIGNIFFDDPVGQPLASREYLPRPLVAYLMEQHGYTLREIAIALGFKNTTAVWHCCWKVKVLLVDIEEVCLQMKDELQNALQANPADNTIMDTFNVLFGIWSGKHPEVIRQRVKLSPKAFDGERVKLRKLAYKILKERDAKWEADDFSDLFFPADETVN